MHLIRGICRRYATTTHYFLKPRSKDPRWSKIDMNRTSEVADVVIVGGGPGGLSVGCRLKQLAKSAGIEMRVVLLEKAGHMGGHTLAGACIESSSLDKLFPNWKALGAPLLTEVTEERFIILSKRRSLSLPVPPGSPVCNRGNYVVRLGNLVRWLADQAEHLGVEVYCGVGASEILYNEIGGIVGVATNDVGIHKDGSPKDSFQRGLEFKSRQVVFAEGCRGHLSKQIIEKFGLGKASDHQVYGIGLKELWEIKKDNWRPGRVEHGVGWPLGNSNGGGFFIYHYNEGSPLVAVGLVMALDYSNPYISPFREFQRLKHHPHFATLLEGGKRIGYGARAINEGGFQSLPRLTVPGGLLVGCAAGFLNPGKIKGVHNAIRSGCIAAEAIFEELVKSQADAESVEVTAYTDSIKSSPIWQEMYLMRNIRPSFHAMGAGTAGLLFYGGVIWYLFRGHEPWTFRHRIPDHRRLKLAKDCQPIAYPKPDGILSFDLPSSVLLTGTHHDFDQPPHLTLLNDSVPEKTNLCLHDGPEQRFCPAGVYEFVDTPQGKQLHINAQNCIHCKTCDIKDPTQNINWVVPQGGEGPAYNGM